MKRSLLTTLSEVDEKLLDTFYSGPTITPWYSSLSTNEEMSGKKYESSIGNL
jgi:hypothetical protein